jgi:intracellular sulfur oxidation DsrE/DsrF family protein
MNVYKKLSIVSSTLAMLLCAINVYASVDRSHGNRECPVGLVNNLTLDQEFGPGASKLTHCVKKRHHLKVVVEINRKCRGTMGADRVCDRSGPDALGNMENMIADYEITSGMKRGRDYTMIAIVHGSGGFLLLKGNEYEDRVQHLMDEGVKFYFCQNTTRGFIRAGILPNFLDTGDSPTDHVIPGVEYVTAGFTAIADHQQSGWSVVTP